MPRIGTLSEARAALICHHEFQEPGWRRVGTGTSRLAWLSPKGVVYKTVDSPWWNEDQETEYLTIRRCRRQPLEGWGFPHVNMFKVDYLDEEWFVIAMEYIKGDDSAAYIGTYGVGRRRDAESHFGVGDLHSQNVIVRNGLFYIIDAAIGASSYS